MSGAGTPWHTDDVRIGDPFLPQRQGPGSTTPSGSTTPPRPAAGTGRPVPAPPATPVATTPSVMRTVAAGMEPDVVDPLSRAMRAFDPDAALPPDALGQIGAAALAQYYTPTYNHECEEFQQGWRTAGDIATAVRSCANTYTSYEASTAAYARMTGAQLPQQAGNGNEQSNAQSGGDTAPDPNTTAPPSGPANPAEALNPRLVTDLNYAATAGPELKTNLTNAGAALLGIATTLRVSSGTLPEVGQSRWSTAVFDAPALFTALTARAYARTTVEQISGGAMPDIQSALMQAWSGPAWDAAYPVIQKFGNAVAAAGSRAQVLLNIFGEILGDYRTGVQGLSQACAYATTQIEGLKAAVQRLGPIPANPRGYAAASIQQATEEMSGIAGDLTMAVTTMVSNIGQSIERHLSEVNVLTGAHWSPFPVITSGNDLPDAHTTPPRDWRARPH